MFSVAFVSLLALLGAEGTLLDTVPVYFPADYHQETPAIASGAGSALVVWTDARGGDVDIYASRITETGQRDPGGIPVCVADGTQRAPAAAFDGTNWLVVWHDYRNGSAADIYAARVSQSGAVLDPAGIPVSLASGDQRYPRVVFTGADFMVVWHDYRYGDTADIFAARVTTAGVVLDPLGIAVCVASASQLYPDVAFDGVNALVTWQDRRNGSSYDIYAARIGPAGNVLDPQGLAISRAGASQRLPGIAFDGSNYLIVWQDNRNSDSSDIYATRVDPAGNVLDPNGIQISVATDSQTAPSVAFLGFDYLVAWQDRRDGDSGNVYCCRVTPQAGVLDPAGIPVSLRPGLQGAPGLARLGTDWFCVWPDGPGLNFTRTVGTAITPAGQVLSPGGWPVLVYSNEQVRSAIADNGALSLAVWQDNRPGPAVYGLRLGPDALPLDSLARRISRTDSSCASPAVAAVGDGFIVAWQDRRNAGWDIYAARVAAGGSLLDTSEIAVCRVNGDQQTPRVAGRPDGCLIVWTDTRNGGGARIYGARVDSSGVVLDPDGIVLAAGAYDHQAPAAAWNDDCCLVVWSDWRSGSRYNVYGTRVDANGNVLDPLGIRIAVRSCYQEQPAVCPSDSNWLVTWEDERGAVPGIYGARVSPAGIVLDPDGFPVTPDSLSQQSPALLERGARSLIVWEENSDIQGAELRTDGSLAETFSLIWQPGIESGPALSSGGNGIIVYSGWADAVQGRPCRAQRIWGAALPVSSIRTLEPRNPAPPEPIFLCPNPARDWLQLAGVEGQRLGNWGLPLLDVSGRQAGRLQGGLNDLRALTPGVYFLRLESAPGTRPLKLVIQR
jgi:predicted transcriptional regulator